MPWNIDARVPVLFGATEEAGPDDALLVEGVPGENLGGRAAGFELAPSEHGAGCSCCTPRNPAAVALNRLFQARAKGEAPFFRRVLAVTQTPEAALAVWAAVRSDPLSSGRFRLADG